MTATHSLAPVITAGSAWGDSGPFYDAFQRSKDGSYPHAKRRHVVGPVPTWVAAPHATEASLHEKEPDLRKFLREYGSVFQSGLLSAFDHALVEAAFDNPCGYRITVRRPLGENLFFCGLQHDHDGPCTKLADVAGHISNFTHCQKVALIDPSAGGSDTFAWAIVGWRHMLPRFPKDHERAGQEDPDGQITYKLVFDYVGGIQNATKKGFKSDGIVDQIATDARRHHVKNVYCDQFSQFGLDALFRRKGFGFSFHTWTNQTKERAMERVRAWLADRLLAFGDASGDNDGPTFAKMKHELHSFEEKIAKSGALTFQGRRGGHDDFAMLVLLAAIVDIEKGLPGSPLFLKGSQVAQENSIIENRTPENSLGVMTDSLLDGLAMVLE
jgi:hypothetical protein